MTTYMDLGPCVDGDIFDKKYDKVSSFEYGDMSLKEYKGILYSITDGYSCSIYFHKSIGVVKIAEFMEFHFDNFVLQNPHSLTKSQYKIMFACFFKHRHSILLDLVTKERNRIKKKKQVKMIVKMIVSEVIVIVTPKLNTTPSFFIHNFLFK